MLQFFCVFLHVCLKYSMFVGGLRFTYSLLVVPSLVVSNSAIDCLEIL